MNFRSLNTMNKRSKNIIAVLLIFVLTTPFLWNQKFQVKAEAKATLTGNIFDQGVDRDSDGFFDFLEVRVEVNVSTARNYRVEVNGLLDRDSGLSYFPVNAQYVFLDIGVQVVYFNFKGIEIYGFGLNPTSISHICLYDENNTLLGELNNASLSRKYLYTEFDAPGAILTGVISDQGVDIDGDSAFDYLEVSVQVNVTEAGTYIVEVMGLDSSDFPFSIGIIDSQYVSLDVGIQVVNVHLDGITIYVSGLNPMNISHIVFYDSNYSVLGELYEIPLSREYLYTEFDAPGAVLTGVVYDQGIDVDDNGVFDFLEVGVEVNVTEAGDYIIEVNGLLADNYVDIRVGNSTQNSLDVGIQVVHIRLDGPTIFASGFDPINVSNIILRNSLNTVLGTLSNVPLSREYLYTEFEGPAVMLTGVITDRGIDTDEDGILEYLEIGVEVSVTEAGNYIVEVNGLMTTDNSYIGVSASQSVSLNVGSQVVYVRLNGITIFASGLSPVKVSNVVLYDEFRNYIGSLSNAPLSTIYPYTEFGAPVQVTVGVKVGDWARYNFSYTWQSTDPAATEPPQFQEMRKIEYAKIEVQSINGTTITLSLTYHFINGTDQTLPPMSADMAAQFNTLVIPGNLSEGDIIPGTAAPINGTISRSYTGANRVVNYLGYSSSFFGMNMTQNMYWDKTTGILCEMLMETSTLTDSYVTTISMLLKMTETNMWKMMTELSCSVSKDTITQGDSIVISGSLNVTLSGKTVTLTYKKPDGSTFNRTITTGSDGSYSDSYTPDVAGSWSVTASWEGDSTYYGANSSTRSLTVNSATFILFTPLGMALTGGIILLAVIVAVLVLRRRPKMPESKEI